MNDSSSVKKPGGKVAKSEINFNARTVFDRLVWYLLRHKTIVIVAVVFMIATALAEASFAMIIKFIIDGGFVKGDQWYLKWLGIILATVGTFRAFTGFCANYFTAHLGRQVIFDIRQDIFSKLIRLPTAYFDKNSSSKNVSKLIYDAEATAVATTETLMVMFFDGVKSVALLSYLIYLNWRLTLIFAVALPLLMVLTRYANRRFRSTSRQIQDSMGGIANTVKEASVGAKVIKVYGGQAQEMENFTRANEYNLRKNLKRARVSSAVVPVTLLLVTPVIAFILHYYLNYLRAGPETAGEFVAYLAACVAMMGPLKRIAKINEKIQIGLTAANSVFEIIDAQPEVDSGRLPVTSSRGHLVFEKVSFTYPKDAGSEADKHPVLHDISLDIEPGKRVALVGQSGSGKSTLTSLILRFYKPQQGRITLDRQDINDLRLKDLRDQVSLVSQETTLFDDTIGRNIMYGMLDEFDQARLDRAIKAAHVDEFLGSFPDGLDTFVGEQGLRLSGGQRQRIAIARAIYKDAPILILDEATSALDNKSERYVQEALETLMKGRTSLVIAHRLSTIENADEILVLDQGRIVEQGSHRKLLRKGGMYAELHSAQSKKGRKGFFFFRN